MDIRHLGHIIKQTAQFYTNIYLIKIILHFSGIKELLLIFGLILLNSIVTPKISIQKQILFTFAFD